MKIIQKFQNFLYVVFSIYLFSCSSNTEEILELNENYVSVPDINFEKRLITLGIDSDGVINQRILKADAETVMRLNIDFDNIDNEIRDVTGLEAFVNLKWLSAQRQKINNINLEHNNNLDTLLLSGNNLSSIDVAYNKKLLYLNVQSNQLNEINGLQNLELLKELNLSFNAFENIEIKNASVEKVFISHNYLKTINTKDALNLRSLIIRLNDISTIDITSNKLLETFVASGNKISIIDLSNNSVIKHLYISSNLLNTLDVSNNLKLIDLRVDRNPGLTCIKVLSNQYIPNVYKSSYQSFNVKCN